MSLQVDFMGWKLDNPIIAASGIWSQDGDKIKRALDAGASAVVSKTIVNQSRPKTQPYIAYQNGGMANICFYNDIALEQWAEEMEKLKHAGGKIIASVLAYSPSEMSYIAKKMEQFGADGLEINLSTLMWDGAEVFVSDPKKLQQMLCSVLQAVHIPVMLKISPHVSNLPQLIRAAETSGISAISGIESLRSILGVDIRTGHPLLPTFGGYSGSPIRPLGLAAVATVAQTVSKIEVCGVGGIDNFENVLEYIMLGATTVQIGTAILREGYGVIGKILADLNRWMQENEHDDLRQVRGQALANLYAFDELQAIPYRAKLSRPCTNFDCNICIESCVYQAIQYQNNEIDLHAERCDGCGLCAQRCPQKIIAMAIE